MTIKLYRTSDAVLAVRGEDAFALTAFSFDALFSSPEPEIYAEEALRTAHPISLPELDQPFLPPLESQEVWAAGVTYERSREARAEEAGTEAAGFYARVYAGERPELFFKASPQRVRGHRAAVGIRRDSAWSVPEPELVLALNAAGKVFGFTIGNDLTARDLEGANPLYLAQAKLFRGSCALGPCLVLAPDTGRLAPAGAAPPEIRLTVLRAGMPVFEGRTDTARMRRTPEELAGWLFREEDFPSGCLLMTGTGIVPAADFTLHSRDEIRIAVAGIGELVNAVA